VATAGPTVEGALLDAGFQMVVTGAAAWLALGVRGKPCAGRVPSTSKANSIWPMLPGALVRAAGPTARIGHPLQVPASLKARGTANSS
jgi:hypothetical protein